MSLSLLLPLGLAALAALVVPILIHLVRRPEHQLIDFAALRWLSERVRPRRRLRFEDPWLLLARILLIAALALLLAQAVLDRDPRPARAWIAVAPSVDLAAARDALADRDGEWHWLAPGFAAIGSPLPRDAAPIASLVRELDARLDPGTALSVVVPHLIDGLDGERMHLSRAIDWQVVGAAPVASPIAEPARAHVPIRIALRHGAEAEPAVRYLRAAIAAWNALEPDRYLLDVQPLERVIPDDAHWSIRIGGEPTAADMAWIVAGGRALVVDAAADADGAVVWRDAAGEVIARGAAHGAGRLVRLARAFDVRQLPQLLDADFPRALRALFEDAAEPPRRAPASAIAPRRGAAASTRPPFPLDPWLLVLIGGLFLVERMLATRTRGTA